MSEAWRNDRIGSAERGENPMVLARMKSGFAVIGDTQFLPGYCILLASPRVDSLNELSLQGRSQFLLDMSLLGEAIEIVCKPRRINYSILGNTDPFLHAHVFPRYEWEAEERRPMPVWRYPNEMWSDSQHHYSKENHGQLKQALISTLTDLMAKA